MNDRNATRRCRRSELELVSMFTPVTPQNKCPAKAWPYWDEPGLAREVHGNKSSICGLAFIE